MPHQDRARFHLSRPLRQSHLASDQVLAIVGEGQSTEGPPETQTQFSHRPSTNSHVACFAEQAKRVVLPGCVDDVTLFVLLWVKKHDNATEKHRLSTE